MGKKIWLPMHPRNFGSHSTARPPDRRPSTPQAHSIDRYWQLKCNSRFYLVGNSMAAQTFREKKQQQNRVFFKVIFDVYTHADNRERGYSE